MTFILKSLILVSIIICGGIFCPSSQGFPASNETYVSMENPFNKAEVTLKSEERKYSIGKVVQYIEDKNGNLTIDDVRSEGNETLWENSKWDVPNFGFTKSVYWFRLKIKSLIPENSQWLFELGYALHNELEFYAISSDGKVKLQKAGNLEPFDRRGFRHMNFVFPVSIGPDETKMIYLRSRSSTSMQFPLTLWSPMTFAQEKTTEYGGLLLYYGIVIVMIFYNMFLSFSIRNINYLYYIFYIGSYAIFQSSLNGLAFQYLWPNFPWWANKCIPFFLGSAVFWMFMFSRNFLETRHTAPKYHRFSMIFIIWASLIMSLSFFVPYNVTIIMSASLSLFSLPYLAVMGGYCLITGFRPARFYVLAFTAFFSGGFLAASRMFSLLPSNFITLYGIQIGSALEIILLSLALGDKIRMEQKKAQKEINDLNAGLEDKVVEKTNELRMANIKLQELDKQKTQFFQNISHELRTPLTLIMNPIEDEFNHNKECKNLDIAYKNSKRLYRLVNQLLDFQKYSVSQNTFSLSPINLTELLKSIGEYFEPTCKRKDIRFKSNLYNDAAEGVKKSIYVNGQVDAIEKIVFNYLSNALKHVAPGGSILLRLQEIESHAVISVTDDGSGISEENLKKLFNPFYQIDGSEKRGSEGTGLGLALTKELAEKMGGSVNVTSKVGYGSSFSVTLPILKAAKPILDFVLASDDENITREIVSLLSDSKQISSHKEIDDTLEIDELQKEYLIKVVLSDIDTSGVYGINSLLDLGKNQPECKIFILTGMNDPSILDSDATKNGVISKVFKKPFSHRDVLSEIESALKNSRLNMYESITREYEIKDWHLADVQDESEITKTDTGPAYDDTKRRNETILVVDDMIDMISLISGYLKNDGYDVISAANGKEALAKCRKSRPDLIICDWMMPIMSGPEFISALKEDMNLSSIPAILLTAKSDDDSKKEGVGSGADGFLGKPFDKNELLSLVRNLIKLKKGEKQISDLNRELSDRILKRFLPSQVVEDILKGKRVFDTKPQNTTITVLISNLSDFQEMMVGMGPESIAALLGEYFAEMTEIIFTFGGIVDRFEDSSIRAIFGAPSEISSEEQALKATRCALEMKRKVHELSEHWKKKYDQKIELRMAIHNGYSIVGNIGSPIRSDYTALGPAVVLAKKIENIAKDGEILISDKVRDLIPPDMWVKHGKYKFLDDGSETIVARLLENSGESRAA
ncbi:MAG: response regulator [Oligoflexales bacterium]|nr:response regulator [Oligoflexales bacterium]